MNIYMKRAVLVRTMKDVVEITCESAVSAVSSPAPQSLLYPELLRVWITTELLHQCADPFPTSS